MPWSVDTSAPAGTRTDIPEQLRVHCEYHVKTTSPVAGVLTVAGLAWPARMSVTCTLSLRVGRSPEPRPPVRVALASTSCEGTDRTTVADSENSATPATAARPTAAQTPMPTALRIVPG